MDKLLEKELELHEPEPIGDKATYINALIYGDWGVGKTTLALSSGKRTLFVSSGDGGESVIRNLPASVRDQVTFVQCQGFSHLKAIFTAISERMDAYVKYEMVVVDNISALCDQFLANLVANYTVNKDRHTAKPKGTGISLEAEGMGDYKFLASHMRSLAPVSSRSPVDVVWLAHEREPSFTDEAKGIYLTRPKMPEKASDALAEVCDLVGLLEKKKGKRTLNFNGSDRLAAKSRISELDGKVISVDEFWPLVEKWRE